MALLTSLEFCRGVSLQSRAMQHRMGLGRGEVREAG